MAKTAAAKPAVPLTLIVPAVLLLALGGWWLFGGTAVNPITACITAQPATQTDAKAFTEALVACTGQHLKAAGRSTAARDLVAVLQTRGLDDRIGPFLIPEWGTIGDSPTGESRLITAFATAMGKVESAPELWAFPETAPPAQGASQTLAFRIGPKGGFEQFGSVRILVTHRPDPAQGFVIEDIRLY